MLTTLLLGLILNCAAVGAVLVPPADTQPALGPGSRIVAGEEPIDISVGHLVPCVADWNSDGNRDLIVGQFSGGKIRLYLNQGSNKKPLLKDFEFLKAGGEEISLPAG